MHIIDEKVFKAMKYHVFNADSEPSAVFVHPEEAAMLVALLGPGACITDPNCSILWNEGAEDQPASESYDHVAEVVMARMKSAKRLKRMR